MTTFCVDSITPEANLRAEHGILRAGALAVTSDARVAANQIVQQARAEADKVMEEARAEAQRLAKGAEQDALQRADQLLRALERANETFLLRAQDTIISIAQRLFDQLVVASSPREQIEAALRRVMREAPSKLVNPLLRVHPEDAALIPAIEWEIKPDASLSRGVCRLEAAGGEWCADFSASVAALNAAFARGVEESRTSAEQS
jgi:flagellar biosynthesis/type III secretory pathway protein FliH